MAIAIPIAMAAMQAYSAYKQGKGAPKPDLESPSYEQASKYNKFGYRDVNRLRKEGIGSAKLSYLGMTPEYKSQTLQKYKDEFLGQQTANEQALRANFGYGTPGGATAGGSGVLLKALGRLRANRLGLMSGAARDIELADWNKKWENFYDTQNLYGNRGQQIYQQYSGAKGVAYNAALNAWQARNAGLQGMTNAVGQAAYTIPQYFNTSSSSATPPNVIAPGDAGPGGGVPIGPGRSSM